MFPADLLGAGPNLHQVRCLAQVVDVPVKSCGFSLVMPQAGLQPSWPEGTAHIGIETGGQFHSAQLPYPDGTLDGRVEE